MILAARIHAFGSPDELGIDEVEPPVPGPGEALVRVEYAGLNPLDYKMRDGSSGKAAMLTLPAVLGREFAGTVIGAGPGVDLDALGIPEGTAVFGVRAMDDPRGTDAQEIAAATDLLAPVPGGKDLPEYAGMPIAGLTAIDAVRRAKAGRGSTVLVQGGTGGVGQVIVQLAVAAGARVWATGREENAERIRQLGATPIEYDREDWAHAIMEATDGEGVDAVIDTHYFNTFVPSFDVLKKGGTIVELPSLADLAPAKERGIDAQIPQLHPTEAGLRELARFHEEGHLDIEIGHVYPLAEIAEAHRQLETGHTRGKLILDLR